jgi:hypothetical protein
MKTPRIAAAASVLLFLPALVASAVSQRIPVVTQVQGVVFYRTFLMIGVASGSPTVTPRMILTFRSPVDGTVQTDADPSGSDRGRAGADLRGRDPDLPLTPV